MMYFNLPSPSLKSVPTSISGTGMGRMATHSASIPDPILPSMSSAPGTSEMYGQQGFESTSVGTATNSAIDKITGQTAIARSSTATGLTIIPPAIPSGQAEMGELAECVYECLSDLQADAAEDPTGKSAKLLRELETQLRKRGIDLKFFTKPWTEKGIWDALGTVIVYLLFLIPASGMGYVAVKAYDRIKQRVQHTPQNAPGVWGYLRRRGFMLAPVPASTSSPLDAPPQPGIELAPLSLESTPAGSVHSVPASSASGAGPNP